MGVTGEERELEFVQELIREEEKESKLKGFIDYRRGHLWIQREVEGK